MSKMVPDPTQPDVPAVVQRSYARAPEHYREAAAVCEVAQLRLLARLDPMQLEARSVVDLGCGDGVALDLLRQRFAGARITGIDVSHAMLQQGAGASAGGARQGWRDAVSNTMARVGGRLQPQRVNADAHCLPFADASIDLVLSNMMLPWCHDQSLVVNEMARVLRPGGAILFTSAGPDTLLEYRELWRSIDRYPHTFGLIDMHHLGDMMLAAGLEAPVMDRELLKVSYPNVTALVDELRRVGAVNIAAGRRKGLIAADTAERLAALAAGESFVTTLELVYGHAWKPADSVRNLRGGNEQTVSLDSLRQQLGRKKDG